METFLKIVLRTNSDLQTRRFLAIFTFFCQLDHSRDSPRSGDFSDLTFHLSEVLNDITGIAKHYWMNVMIDLAVAQSDHIICFWSLHASLRSVRVKLGAQHCSQYVSEPDTSQTTGQARVSCVQTGWSRFHLFF